MRLTLVVVADIAPGAEHAFQRYEDAVLPLLARHRGRLERRLRTGDGRSEVHVVSFGSEDGYRAYLVDPERQSHTALLAGSDVTQRVLRVIDV